MNDKMVNAYKIPARKPQGTRSKNRWEYNIETHKNNIFCYGP
jgi:hypothetical protein